MRKTSCAASPFGIACAKLWYGRYQPPRSYRRGTWEDGWQSPLGRRVTPSMVLTMLAKGGGREAVLEAYPALEPADIDACLLYAARLSELAKA